MENIDINDTNKNNIMLFNVEPLTSYKWLDIDRIIFENNSVRVFHKNEFNDPFFTGSDTSCLTIGNTNGIYTNCRHHFVIQNFNKILQSEFARIRNIKDKRLTRISLLYAFSIDIGKITVKDISLYETGTNFSRVNDVSQYS